MGSYIATEKNGKLYYNTWAQDDVYDIIIEVMPLGFELVTLDNDDEKECLQKIAEHIGGHHILPLARKK